MPKPLRIILYIFLGLGGVVAFFLIGFVIFNFLLMPWIVHQGKEIEVPELVGKTLPEVQELLKSKELTYEVYDERPDTLWPQGYVMEQRPNAGTVVKAGRMVSLVVSTGPQRLRVPYLYGLSLDQAENIAENLGLKVVKVETLASDSFPEGRICRVFPEPTTAVDKGSPLELGVSLGGSGKITVPNLVGLKLVEAESVLTRSQLILGEVKEVTAEGDPGMVLIQSPPAGAQVDTLADTVRLIIIKRSR
jgi:serine/threonine-protein kinase